MKRPPWFWQDKFYGGIYILISIFTLVGFWHTGAWIWAGLT